MPPKTNVIKPTGLSLPSLPRKGTDLVNFVVTPEEYEKIRLYVDKRLNLTLPSLPPSTAQLQPPSESGTGSGEAKQSSSQVKRDGKGDGNVSVKGAGSDDADFLPSTSRRAIRIFLASYALSNVWENVLVGVMRRKQIGQFIRDLFSPSSFNLSLFLTTYSTLYRILYRLTSRNLPPFAARRLLQLNSQAEGGQTRGVKSTTGTGTAIRVRKYFYRTLASPYLPPMISALLSSPAILLDGTPVSRSTDNPHSRRQTLSLYVLIRALQSLYSSYSSTSPSDTADEDPSSSSSSSFRLIPKRFHWYWGPHILFGLSNSILLHTFIFNPSCFPKSYSDFILSFSKAYVPQRPKDWKDGPWPNGREIADTLANLASDPKKPYPKYVSPLLHPSSSPSIPDSLSKVNPILEMLSHPGHENLLCAILHPGQPDCLKVFRGFVVEETGRTARYMAIVGAIGVAVRWKSLVKHPESTLYKYLLTILTSSLTLTLSIGTAWTLTCLFQILLPPNFLPKKRFYIQGFLAGLWLILQCDFGKGPTGGGRGSGGGGGAGGRVEGAKRSGVGSGERKVVAVPKTPLGSYPPSPVDLSEDEDEEEGRPGGGAGGRSDERLILKTPARGRGNGGGGGRGTDLALYAVRLALVSLWQVGKKEGRVKGVKNGEVFLFAASMSLLMAVYEVNPSAISSGFVTNILKWLFGEAKVPEKSVVVVGETGTSGGDGNGKNGESGRRGRAERMV